MACLAARPVMADTLWWRTTGGTVTEHRTDTISECVLTFQAGAGYVAFSWPVRQPFHATIGHRGWTLPDDAYLRVALAIGDVWIGGGGERDHEAITQDAQSLIMLPEPPIDSLLLRADHLTIRLEQGDTRFQLPPAPKIALLLSAVHQCREALHIRA